MDFRRIRIPYRVCLFVVTRLIPFSAGAQTDLVVSAKANGSSGRKYESAVERNQNKVVAITGVRFAYPLVQKWIDDYNKISPAVQIIIESRGSSDPAKYDILVEAFEPDEEKKATRDYSYIARYAILPVVNSQAAFAKVYASKGLTKALIKQLFFHDIFADKKEQLAVKEPYTVYTRLQKAGAPITFSKYFGYQQKDIRGKSIAGADEHLLKAVLRDSTGLTYLPMNLVFDQKTGMPVQGITILPIDLNGNGKVSDEEKIYNNLPAVIRHFEGQGQKELSNVPIEYLNVSIEKNSPNAEAVEFLQWVIQHAGNDLHAFGFLKPEKQNQP